MNGSWISRDTTVDKGERTAAYTGRCRELFEKAAREGIKLPDVARGYLMLRGAPLGLERKAIVLAAAGQSYTERNVAQALRSTFPINLGVTKEFVHVMDDCDEPLMPLEEQSMSEVDSGGIDALITNFETLSNTTEESCPIDEEEAVRTLVTWKESRQNLNMVKRDRNFSQSSNSQTPSQERASPVSDEADEEEETCLLLHKPGKAIIDTGCGRCVMTLEAHQSVMEDRAKETVWQRDAPLVVFLLRQWDQGSKHWCH